VNTAKVQESNNQKYLYLPKKIVKLRKIKKGDVYVCLNNEKEEFIVFKKVDSDED
jgi:hypothetical protein